MFPELTDDVFDSIFVDQEVSQHDILWRSTFLDAIENLLLIFFCNLRVRDKRRQHQSMGFTALCAEDTLNTEFQEFREIFHVPVIVSVADQTALLPAGTLHRMKLEIIYNRIIRFLRKTIEFFVQSRYHSLVLHKRGNSLVV